MSRPDPLPARSVLLSVLLGSHPPELPVRTLVHTAGLCGIAEGTARVALSRLTADGEVETVAGTYRLSPRHLERQHDQDVAHRPRTRPWRGGWDIVVVAKDGDSAPLERRRLAELHPGVWVRPDNLIQDDNVIQDDNLVQEGNLIQDGPGAGSWVTWNGKLAADVEAGDLVARLWDLPGWNSTAQSLMAELAEAAEPAERLSTAAAMVRHIRSDPVLPPALLPEGWSGARLRRAYDSYRAELGRWIAQQRDS